jgi:hypothetical protein
MITTMMLVVVIDDGADDVDEIHSKRGVALFN